jgi:hypothetical protein
VVSGSVSHWVSEKEGSWEDEKLGFQLRALKEVLHVHFYLV